MHSTSGSIENLDALYTSTSKRELEKIILTCAAEAKISRTQWEEMMAAVGVDKIEDVLKLHPDDFNTCKFQPLLQRRIEEFQTLLSIRH